ncbi:UNVERIFIED_CONTAM: hypothetical protein ABIC26_003009 [Paenibacillus sp. PvR008]
MTLIDFQLLRNNVPEFELITLSNGDKVYIRALNKVSDQARKNINHTYNNFIKLGKL